MGDKTGISWTDHTFNPVWGCTKIAPGCDNCYAANLDKRTGGDHWNPHVHPRLTSDQNWNKPKRWNRLATEAGVRRRVFCGSMCDWTNNANPDGMLDRLWALIDATPMLDWQLLTKRATRIGKCLPADFSAERYSNVWLGVTVENREHGYPRIEALRQHAPMFRFLSVEPLLESVADIDLVGIDWVICGGESGPSARPFDPLWGIELRDRCRDQGVAYWFKQYGQGPDKGGCLLEGVEVKEWPQIAA